MTDIQPRIDNGQFTHRTQSAAQTSLEPSDDILISAEEIERADGIPDEMIRHIVRGSLGYRELDDHVVVAGARLLTETYSDLGGSALEDLGVSGRFTRDGMKDVYQTAYSRMSPRDRDLASMIGTWAMHRGDQG